MSSEVPEAARRNHSPSIRSAKVAPVAQAGSNTVLSAGGAGWHWHRVVPLLRDAGHKASAVDLVLAGADDRFFPVAFQQDQARDRMGLEADVLPGGHLIALSQPARLADYLLAA